MTEGKETMPRTKLPEFKGKPLIEIPQNIPQIGFLEGDFGKAFLEEYKERVRADYNGNSALNVLSYADGVVKGSNPFAVVLANQILRQERLRTATQADLEKALRTGALNLRGFYEDTGLVLRTEEDEDYSRNTSLARYLSFQILARNLRSHVKARWIKFSPKNPVMVPLTGLELEKANNDYSLALTLREDAEIYKAPILNKETGNFSFEDIDEKTGLPTKLRSDGDRTFYTRDNGLSRLYLYGGLDAVSSNRDLAYSDDDGRVVVVKSGVVN